MQAYKLRITDDDVTRIMIMQLLEVGAKFTYEFTDGVNIITADRSTRDQLKALENSLTEFVAASRQEV